MNDTRDLSDFIHGVRTNAWGCDGFLLGVADLFGVPSIVDSIKFDSDERCMAQITWPTAAATPQHVLHLFLQHDKHCVAIARVAAAADGLGNRHLRPKGNAPPPPANAPPAAAPEAAMDSGGEEPPADDDEGPVCEIINDGAPGVPQIPEVLCAYPPGDRRHTPGARCSRCGLQGPRGFGLANQSKSFKAMGKHMNEERQLHQLGSDVLECGPVRRRSLSLPGGGLRPGPRVLTSPRWAGAIA